MTNKNISSKLGQTIHIVIVSGLMLLFMIWTVLGISTAQGMAEEHPKLVQVVQSQKSFFETVKAFKKEVTQAGWNVLNMNNMAGVLSERGFTLHPVVTLDVCKGRYSVQILSNDQYRPISAFMPCRVSIYQTSAGKVFMARMNAGAVANMMPPEVARIMSASDQEIAEIIAKTVR